MEFIDYKRLYELSIIDKEKIFNEKECIIKEIDILNNKITLLTENLKKYTNNKTKKVYYEKNKEKIIEHIKNYNKEHKKDPEKIKEYNKRSYEKRKLKNTNNLNI
jgi:hypothetical protein